MKKALLTLVLAMFSSTTLWAQQALFDVNNLTSPEIRDDASVTFRLFAPAATTVEVEGDFGGKVAMTKGDDGVWTYTTAPLEPEMYSYRFKVDGIDVLDPSNVYRCRDIASYANIFIISKGNDDAGWMYSVNKVPHGNVSKVWYPSPTSEASRLMTVYTPSCYDEG